MTKEEALDALTELSSTLSAEERDQVLDSMHICQLNKNEVIYQEGDEPQNLFCLLQGKVKIYIDGIGGRCQIVRVYDDFEYFGYRAAFSGDKYATSAAAIEPSCLVCIPLAVIKSLLQVNPRLSGSSSRCLPQPWARAMNVLSISHRNISVLAWLIHSSF